MKQPMDETPQQKHHLQAYWDKRNQELRDAYEANPKSCPNCGVQLPYEKHNNKYCSRSCATIYNKSNNVRLNHDEDCANCGSIKETRHNKYCDACIAEGVYNKPTLENIKSPYGLRSYLRRTREHKCTNCGITEWNGKHITLEVHHVDGNPNHNTEENLKLLCPNCHSLTKTYKANSIKHGKKGRHKRRIMRRKNN